MSAEADDGFLKGVTVLELANELGEYCGKVLAGLGAEVIKVEPPGGEETRGYGPFAGDVEDPNGSLYFWNYNFGKRSVVVDLDTAEGIDGFVGLLKRADVLIDSRPLGYLEGKGLSDSTLWAEHPRLVIARITPFGETGPWAKFQGTDLVHLALGGVMMNCGYDPDPGGHYETPPIAPQMWQAYHITGEVAAIQIVTALNYAAETGVGQRVAVAVHDAVSKNTETDLPDWVYAREAHYRQTCRHSFANIGVPAISRTKDGRWLLPYRTYLPGFVTSPAAVLHLARQFGMEFDLAEPIYHDLAQLRRPEVDLHVGAVLDRLIGRLMYGRDVWKDAQAVGLTWAPLRRPEENAPDEHWRARGTFAQVAYPEREEEYTQVTSRWKCDEAPWRRGPRAPLLGEHSSTLRRGCAEGGSVARPEGNAAERGELTAHRTSPHGKPFALDGVRIVDLSWLLASGGAGRFFTAHGAEVIKIEHASRVDAMRMGAGRVPADPAEPSSGEPASTDESLNRSGAFMEINAGKRSFSLNLKDPRGRALLLELVRTADMVVEGFSPGTMDRMGLGYDVLKEANPTIIYVQQSGMGQAGTYGGLRSYGPTAQAFSGLSEMSGLSDPYPPAGIGYSYLDWFGAYQVALAMMVALYRRRRTGKGCWIDASQVECGIYLTGTAILDFAVNGRSWERYGNDSPYKVAAPHGAYRARGRDRWIAIAAHTDAHWTALIDVLDRPAWAADPRFATLQLRYNNRVALDARLNEVTQHHEAYELMNDLQRAGVPAGVCQTAQDRCESDPQLRHLGWLVDLPQSEIGVWPVKELPGQLSETPSHIGGVLNRHGPNYGEDTEYVLRDVLGLSALEATELKVEGVV